MLLSKHRLEGWFPRFTSPPLCPSPARILRHTPRPHGIHRFRPRNHSAPPGTGQPHRLPLWHCALPPGARTSPEGLRWVSTGSGPSGTRMALASLQPLQLSVLARATWTLPLVQGSQGLIPSTGPDPLSVVLCSAPHPIPIQGSVPRTSPKGSPHCPRPSWSTSPRRVPLQEAMTEWVTGSSPFRGRPQDTPCHPRSGPGAPAR